MSVSTENLIIVGYVSGLFGIRGWIKVFSYTRPRENIFIYNPWLIRIDGEWREVTVLDSRQQGKNLVAQLEGYADPDLSASLNSLEIAIDRSQLEELDKDEYYWADLVGLQVINSDGQNLGVIKDLMETGSNDVLVVQGEQQCLIPYVPGVHVLAVDLAAGQMQVDWQEPE